MTGPGVPDTLMTTRAVSEQPHSFFTTSTTVSIPALEKVWLGFSVEEKLPSPKFQNQDTMGEYKSATDESVNITLLPRQSVIELAENFACGLAITCMQAFATPEHAPALSYNVTVPVMPTSGHKMSTLSP